MESFIVVKLISAMLISIVSSNYEKFVLDDSLSLNFAYTIYNTGLDSFRTKAEDGGWIAGARRPDGIAYPAIITNRHELYEYLSIYEYAFSQLNSQIRFSDLYYFPTLAQYDDLFFRYKYLVIIQHEFGGSPTRSSVDYVGKNGIILITDEYCGPDIIMINNAVHFVIELSNDTIPEYFSVRFDHTIINW